MGTIVSFGVKKTESVQSAFLWMDGYMYVIHHKMQTTEGREGKP